MVVNDMVRSLTPLARMQLVRTRLRDAADLLDGMPEYRMQAIRDALFVLTALMNEHIDAERRILGSEVLASALTEVRSLAADLARE